jgi:hypothetical protein
LYRPINLIYSACFPVNKHEYLKTTKQSAKRGLGQKATTTINSRKKSNLFRSKRHFSLVHVPSENLLATDKFSYIELLLACDFRGFRTNEKAFPSWMFPKEPTIHMSTGSTKLIFMFITCLG